MSNGSNEQYDMPSDLRKLYEKKSQQRAAAKQYFLNYLYNPHRPINDGLPFDPALQRFSAMSAYHVENFKPKPRHWAGYALYVSIFFGFAYFITKYKENQEKLLRSGTVKYADRDFKLIF